ncbi:MULTISPECIES: efflux RND transporter periplasmic adaptor subunit [Rhizobium/Agrobacterium group]|uniref:efflux RND transporter periplasmic adaptor subunit n=1 Tax=Rhizobium/Agrobacterium group TaxID=227290 RepID=UPI0023011682|nr:MULTISPECIES: efflux RND transporter periplasmic adaptor subunit [Rhizobium/Agrobacterium group]MDA5634981.1 efflux RND transporter periplasmic adaptor subunit [Agrobacterium sp. ST15.16.024]MDF1890129.1 efflux RND transporter periplasmic adaptor subunit [Rhizobium rhizogenes]
MGITDRFSKVLLASMIAASVGMTVPARAQDAPKVATMKVAVDDVSPEYEFVGRIEALNAVDIRSRIDGFIDARSFEEGAEVEEGQELFRIDSRALEIALSDARANLTRANATLLDAERQLARNQSLNQSIARATVEQSETARDTASASAQSAEAAVKQAELNLSYSHIISPLKGRIGTAAFSVGSYVTPSSAALARVVQLDPVRVVFSVSDRALLDLREAAGGASKDELALRYHTRLRLSNGQIYPQTVPVTFLGSEVDEGTGTLPIRSVFPNSDFLLIPGQFVTVVVSENTRLERPTVPLGAVQQDREGRYVMLVTADKKATQRRITVSEQRNGAWIVESGLEGGEDVIIEGLQNVTEGSVVDIIADKTSSQPVVPK